MSTLEAILAEISKGDITIKQALERAMDSVKTPENEKTEDHLLWSNYGKKSVFIRTVTHHYTGKMEALSDGFILLSDAAWIADDGRFNECLANGTLKEVEPYPNKVCVAIGSIVDICVWDHPLPRKVK